MKSFMKNYAHKFDMIRSLLNKEDPIVVEIGSHYGEDTLRFLESFKDIKIYCIEPDPRNIRIFKKYVKDDRAKLFEIALSHRKGNEDFYQSYQDYEPEKVPDKYDWISKKEYIEDSLNNSGSSSLKKGYAHVLDKRIKVQTDRYDAWSQVNGIKSVDFVWIDVQGAEKDVIIGMGESIKNIKYIWMEYGERCYEGAMNREETVFFMESLGFIEDIKFSSQEPQGDILFYNADAKKHIEEKH